MLSLAEVLTLTTKTINTATSSFVARYIVKVIRDVLLSSVKQKQKVPLPDNYVQYGQLKNAKATYDPVDIPLKCYHKLYLKLLAAHVKLGYPQLCVLKISVFCSNATQPPVNSDIYHKRFLFLYTGQWFLYNSLFPSFSQLLDIAHLIITSL